MFLFVENTLVFSLAEIVSFCIQNTHEIVYAVMLLTVELEGIITSAFLLSSSLITFGGM